MRRGIVSNSHIVKAKVINGAPLSAGDRDDLVAIICEFERLAYEHPKPLGMAGLSEANIRVSGEDLNFGQSMAVRVAVSSFLMSMSDPETRANLGVIADGYHDRLKEVEGLIFKAFR